MADFTEILRPIQSGDGSYAALRFKLFNKNSHTSSLTVVEGPHTPISIPPPDIELDTGASLNILQLLEFAGVHYLNPDCPAAEQGVEIFKSGRTFALESAPEWVGFDWDFTTNIYKIYGPLIALIATNVLHTPPRWIQNKSISLFEAAKPGVHELIMGMAVGYALRQGLRRFTQWEYYRPQVRWVTQTWPDRLAFLGTRVTPLIPLMMGHYPGKELTESDIRHSNAFITLEDFMAQIERLLQKFIDGNCQFHILASREQDEVMEILKAGKAYKLKPLSTFAAKGWLPPQLLFDDSPTSIARLHKDGVRVVRMVNPIAPGKDMTEIRALSLTGRRAAASKMIRMASQTEGPALIEALKRLARGEMGIALDRKHLTSTPEGSVLILHDLKGTISDLLLKFRIPQREINGLIQSIVRKAGGLTKLESQYLNTASLRISEHVD